MLTNYTIHPLTVGFNETDQGILTYQRFYGKRIILPIYTMIIAKMIHCVPTNISRKSYHNWFVLQFRKFSLWWRYYSAWRIAERNPGL